ncbi:MBL fold metallo-hydrolase [Brevibacillus dissolubilis]|uniref:MBL fold metallo-hydrolase n=1 Tax=Brevibacillus dissolubilis TaxID=1844116 RepID=UPI00159B902B|nr:MBL fold metallo-hydrolase [Brevibacillus dissolubilis]
MQRQSFGEVTVFTSVIWQTCSTVVEEGERIFLFDPAYFPNELDAIADYVNEIRRGRELILVLTHGDWDHIVGYPLFADATVVAHKRILAEGRLEGQIESARRFDERYYVMRPEALQIPRIDRVIEGVEEVGEWKTTFYPVPGHVDDMIATYIHSHKTLVVGDILSDMEFPFVYHSYEEYLATLTQMEELVTADLVELLIPGHGNPTTEKREMLRRIDQDRRYLEETREAVVQGVANGLSEEAIKEAFGGIRYAENMIQGEFIQRHLDNMNLLMEHISKKS